MFLFYIIILSSHTITGLLTGFARAILRNTGPWSFSTALASSGCTKTAVLYFSVWPSLPVNKPLFLAQSLHLVVALYVKSNSGYFIRDDLNTLEDDFGANKKPFVGSMEAPSKAFLLSFLLPDWLKLNHLKSRMECRFSDIFSRHFCST